MNSQTFVFALACLTLASCASAAEKFGAVPSLRQLKDAVDEEDFRHTFETVSCIDWVKCSKARPEVRVRKISCVPMTSAKAHCSYEYTNSNSFAQVSNDFEIGIHLDGKSGWIVSEPKLN